MECRQHRSGRWSLVLNLEHLQDINKIIFYTVHRVKDFSCMVTDDSIHLDAGFVVFIHDNDHLNQMGDKTTL